MSEYHISSMLKYVFMVIINITTQRRI